jgi:hypothetical protein
VTDTTVVHSQYRHGYVDVYSLTMAGAGQVDFVDTELEGVKKLDSTLFVCIAAETANRLGWLREGDKAGGWPRKLSDTLIHVPARNGDKLGTA